MSISMWGQSLTGTTANRPLGNKPAANGAYYWDYEAQRMFVAADNIAPGFLIPVDGMPVFSTASPRHVYDPFTGGSLNTTIWDAAVGNDAQAILATPVAGAPISTVLLTSGNAGTGIAADGSVIASKSLTIEAEEGRIVGACRFKVATVTSCWLFIGFTDVLPSTTLEAPATLSGTTFTTNATDACGILFDTAATTDTIRIVGVKDGVDATHGTTGVALGTGWNTLILDVSTAGDLTVTLNGTKYAVLEDAVSPGVDLCMLAGIDARTTEVRTLELDYMGYR